MLKPASNRNKLATDEELIGFEMEGAGVWDNIPCLPGHDMLALGLIGGAIQFSDINKQTFAPQRFTASTDTGSFVHPI